jgi:histidine phosphotransfer protein HptB
MGQTQEAIVDWERFAQARATLGVNFLRVIGYFSDDGAKSVAAIEDALRTRNAIGMIGPADLLKSDAMQIGALSVAEIAEDIEFGARDCVEWRQSPEILLEPVMQLRALFEDSVQQFDKEVNPLMTRRVG